MQTKLKLKPFALMLALLLLALPITASAEHAQSPTRVPSIGENVTIYTGGDVLDLSALVFHCSYLRRIKII